MRKIERNIEKYSLESLNQELHRRHQDGESLRDLAAFVNKRILEAALDESGVDIISHSDSIYEALRGNDVSVGRRAEVSSKLTQKGVPMGEVEDDFVSHQTVREHLQNCLNRDTSRKAEVTVEDAIETIEWSRTRCTAVIERTVTRLDDADHLQADDIDISQAVRITCNVCSQSYRLHDFIENGGCPHTDSSSPDSSEVSGAGTETN